MPKKLTEDDVLDVLLANQRRTPEAVVPSRAKVKAALAKVDQDKHIADVDTAYEGEVWDGESDILGFSAAEFKAHLATRGTWPEGGLVYLIKDAEGRALLLQDKAPGAGRFKLTKTNVNEHMSNHLGRFKDREAKRRVFSELRRHLHDTE